MVQLLQILQLGPQGLELQLLQLGLDLDRRPLAESARKTGQTLVHRLKQRAGGRREQTEYDCRDVSQMLGALCMAWAHRAQHYPKHREC